MLSFGLLVILHTHTSGIRKYSDTLTRKINKEIKTEKDEVPVLATKSDCFVLLTLQGTKRTKLTQKITKRCIKTG